MVWKVGAKRGYPIMKLRKWKGSLCSLCHAPGPKGCLEWREHGGCPIETALAECHNLLEASNRRRG